jgi:hypothetical protein
MIVIVYLPLAGIQINYKQPKVRHRNHQTDQITSTRFICYE